MYNLDYFAGKSWSFVLIKNGKIIYKSKLQGLKPLVLCFKKCKQEMRGATVYDKIIGRAAAILLVNAKVGEVWTPTVSMAGRKILKKQKIRLEYKKEVKSIMNRKGDDFCPMEILSAKLSEKEFIKKMLS